jgi:hypothetical protein
MDHGPAVRDTRSAPLRAAAPGQLARMIMTEPGVELAIVVPTFEERDNIAPLIVRLVQRLGRRGLSSACVEGILSCSAPYIAVMDADLQHDETLLPRMLTRLKAEELDLVRWRKDTVSERTGRIPRVCEESAVPGIRLVRAQQRHNLEMHRAAPRPSGERQAGSGG